MMFVVSSWIILVTSQVAKIMQNLHESVYLGGVALNESHVQSGTWKIEVEKLLAMVSQLVEVEEFGPEKFLQENPLQHVDVGLIHVLRKNIAWRVSNYTSTI